MKISLALFVYLLHGINCMKNTSHLTKYLDERAKIVGEKLIRHARNQENLYTVKVNNTNQISLIGNYSNGKIFTFFNTPYALIDQNIYKISQNNYSLVHVLSKNGVLSLKTTEFKSLGFMAFRSSNALHILGFHKTTQTFFKIQNIVFNITDYAFFQYNDTLYLIVLNYRSYDLTSVIVYKFVDTHFDETVKFLTSGATRIHTFPNNESEIIIILHKNEKTSTLVEFQNERVKIIQKIDIKGAEEALDYLYEEKRYLIVFTEDGNGKLYLWTGSDLLFWEDFALNPFVTKRKDIFYVNNNPYLFTSTNETFLIFSLINNQFSLIYKFNLTNYVWLYKNKKLITLGPSNNNTINFNEVIILIESNLMNQKLVEEKKLSNCFLTLEKAAYSFRNKLTKAQNLTRTTLRDASNDFSFQKFEDLRTKYAIIKASLENRKSKSLVIDDPAVIKFPLKTQKLVAKEIKFDELNNHKWQPENWLSYSKPQNISGPVKAQLVQVKNFETNINHFLFSNLLLSSGNQNLTGFVTIHNLETSEIETNSINGIPADNFYYKSQPSKILGAKKFPELKAKNIDTAAINGMDVKKVMAFFPDFDPNLKIDNLLVENINEINFENFKNSVFRIGLNTINGNLTLYNLQANKIIFKTLSKQPEFLTTSTDQTVHSSLRIPKIFTHNIKTSKINGIDFKNNAATVNGSVITGPVSIKHLNVKNNLELQGDVDNEFLLINDTHIVGTHESDFLQIYDGKVKIKGNLILKNFDLGKSAKIIVSGSEFNPKFDNYWTKSTQQEIPTHFEAQNGISTPHLSTIFINNVHVNDYLLNSTEQKKTAKFYFDNVTIKGNVLLNPDEEHSPDLQRIQKESVKINGTFDVKGRKIYTNILKVKKLDFNQLNGIDATDYYNSTGTQNLKNFFIKGNLHLEKLSVDNINNVNLKDLVEDTVFIDKPLNLSKLNFDSVTAKNVFVTSKINNHSVEEITSKLQKINEFDVIEDVFVNNNISIKNVENLSKINGLDVDQLMSKSLSEYDKGTVFGKLTFLENVKIKDLHIIKINDIDFEKLSKRTLYRLWNQQITEHFTFNNLKSENLMTDYINNFHVKNLIDISSNKSQIMLTPKGLIFKNPVKIENLVANIGCDINESLGNLRNPPSQLWDSIEVTGNVTCWDKDSLMSEIFENVVTSHKRNQTIKGKVNLVNNILTNTVKAKKINNVDILEITNDAFINKPNIEQVVTGKKTFSKLEAQNVETLQNTNVTTINDINISEINNKIISKNSTFDVPIKGKKTFFGGLQVNKLETSSISGLDPNNLVSSTNSKEIPNAIFESVSVTNNFNVKFVNNMPFEVVLNERFLKNAPKQVLKGNYFFQKVKIIGNVTTPQINDVKITKVVYDDGNQTVESPKSFSESLRIVGDVKVGFINGVAVSEAYEQAVLKNEETNFKRTVFVLKPTLVDGNIQTNYINNVSMNFMLETTTKNSLNSETEKIQEMTREVTGFIKKCLNTTIRMPTEVMYLEKASDLQISLPNTISAEVVETKDDILIHVESEEEGYACDLPQPCKCPLQQTVQISSEHSVNMFINKATQRIYGHYDEDIIVHFITHSVSTSSYCRTSKTKVLNEVSSLTWNIPPRGNNTGGFFIHRGFFTGYISGVKFFTIYGKTYVVVGVYYDPVLDTHKVNSIVLRFSDDKTKIEEIQKIPTIGLKTISLFPTAQGVILIMGNAVSDSFNNTNTKIYRFNQLSEQFELLRDVPSFGSLYVQGVVLETDSLIILANERSTLHIFKYQVDFDNYYFYQSFQLDYPVSSLSVFYAEGFGISDAYLSVVTKNNRYFIFSFQFIEGWKIEFTGELDGVKSLVPFKLNKKLYLFAASSKMSSLLTLVEHDSN